LPRLRPTSSRPPPPLIRRPARRPLLGLALAWILLFGLSGNARADSLEDALRCLEEQKAAEARRDLFLQRADSLGQRIAAIRAEGKEAPQDLLRAGEKIQRQATEEELDLLRLRLRCRDLARRGVSDCQEQIDGLQRRIREGRGDTESAGRLLRLQETRATLEAAVSGPVTLRYPLLPADSTDTQDVLRGKLQYYRDVRGSLEELGKRVDARLEQAVEERRTLAEAQRFLRDLEFLGEGGRALPGGQLRANGGEAGRPIDPEGLARAGSDSAAGLASRDLEFVLALTPTTPEQSDQLIQLLRRYSEAIGEELSSVQTEIDTLERRILPIDERR